jgi:ABC-type dipeptide/oligopeptide/nickel transport system permease subunit
LIHGSRISLAVGFVAVGISTIIGIVAGAILGYFGGKVDFIGMRIVEAPAASFRLLPRLAARGAAASEAKRRGLFPYSFSLSL